MPAESRETELTTAPCLQCGVEKPVVDRCPACGMTAEFGPDRPNPFAGAAIWAMMGAILLVFAITIAVVAVTN